MSSYGHKTLGEAITYCVNQLFLEEEKPQSITRDERDVEEIAFLRELSLAQTTKEVTINISGTPGGGNYTPPTKTPLNNSEKKDEKKKLTEEELKALRASMAGNVDNSVEELDAIYETGNANPSNVLDISAPSHKDANVESVEQYEKRMRTRLKAAAKGKLQPEKEVLKHGVMKSMEETKVLVEEKKLVTHPSGLAPPGPSEE